MGQKSPLILHFIEEVKQLIEELAKKIAITAAELTSEQLGNHLSVYK